MKTMPRHDNNILVAATQSKIRFSPDLSAAISRKFVSIISKSSGKSRDTLTYLVMQEMHNLCPSLSYVELMSLYADSLAIIACTSDEGSLLISRQVSQ